MVMFTVAALILLVAKPSAKEIPESSVFKAGIVSAVALFGLAWLTDTFILRWQTEIVNTVGGWVNDYKSVFFIGVFLVAALTTSQSTATRTIVPIGLAAGLSPALISGMWAGAFAGVFTLPTNGSQIAAANFDQTGTTKLGTKARGSLVHPARDPARYLDGGRRRGRRHDLLLTRTSTARKDTR